MYIFVSLKQLERKRMQIGGQIQSFPFEYVER